MREMDNHYPATDRLDAQLLQLQKLSMGLGWSAPFCYPKFGRAGPAAFWGHSQIWE
jgi:hypothetical protein